MINCLTVISSKNRQKNVEQKHKNTMKKIQKIMQQKILIDVERKSPVSKIWLILACNSMI